MHLPVDQDGDSCLNEFSHDWDRWYLHVKKLIIKDTAMDRAKEKTLNNLRKEINPTQSNLWKKKDT